MRQIFGDDRPSMSLHMPLDWGTSDLPLRESTEAGVTQPVIHSFSVQVVVCSVCCS